MNVLMLSPGFPDDMVHFTRALAEIGATVFGVGDQHQSALDQSVRAALDDYLQVPSLWDEGAVVHAVRERLRGRHIDRVECLWEPGVTVAARLREAFGVPGLRVDRATPLRDKVLMKDVLAAAGVRVPRHARAHTKQEVRAAVEHTGFPAIVKPVAGAGSADTYRLDDRGDVERVLGMLEHVPEVTVEEFVVGEEFTYDTITANGEILFENVAWYRPKPLVARENPWISPQAVCLRDHSPAPIAAGLALGRQVIRALGLESGMNHMEWFLNEQGEAVFGEIGGRAPGGRLTHAMNYSCDIDLFRGWAEAVCHGRLGQPVERRYNAVVIFKRAEGEGLIRAYEGLERLLAEYGSCVAHVDLVPIGAPRRDWRQVVTGDGWLVVRHPELATALDIADRFGADLRIRAA